MAAVEALMTEKPVLGDLSPVYNYAHFQHCSNSRMPNSDLRDCC